MSYVVASQPVPPRDKLADKEYFSRKEAATYLSRIGCPISAQTLAHLAVHDNAGGGPPYFRVRWNRVCYRRTALDVWARQSMVRVG